jgi:hypothetical protein
MIAMFVKTGDPMLEMAIVEWQEQYRQEFISLSIDWLEKYVAAESIDLEILHDPEVNIFPESERSSLRG